MPPRLDGIRLPTTHQPRPKPAGRRARWSPTCGLGAVLHPDGTVAWQDDDWMPNLLHDAGETSMLDVYLREQANPTKHLGLLNDANVVETDGTMSAVTEAQTPGTGGYARQAVAAADWVNDGLVGGDARFSAAEKTFGPVTSPLTATHASLSTTATGAGLLLLTLQLSGTTTLAVNQSFRYILRWTQS